MSELLMKGKQFVFEENIVFYVDEKGESEANNRSVLLLHGFPTNSFDFCRILGDVKSRFRRVIAVDQLGFGFSEKPSRVTFLRSMEGEGKGEMKETKIF